MSRNQEDGEYAGSGHHGGPRSQGKAKAEMVQKAAEQKWARRSYDILAGKNDSVRHSAVTSTKPFAKREGGGTVDEGAS